MAQGKFFSRLLLLGIIVISAHGSQQKETIQKTDDTEREIKTLIDRTKKILTNYGCTPTSSNNVDVFIVEPDSPVGQALLANQINVFNNAMVFSYGNLTPLVVADKGLIDILTVDELQSILAHEAGHADYKKKNGQKEQRAKNFYIGASCITAAPFLAYYIYIYAWSTSPDFYAKLKAASAYLVGVGLIFSIIPFSRWRERCAEKAADLYAVKSTQSKTLASALEKMRKRETELYPVSTRNYEWQEKWCPWGLNHPTLAERKKYIEACQLPKSEPTVQVQVA